MFNLPGIFLLEGRVSNTKQKTRSFIDGKLFNIGVMGKREIISSAQIRKCMTFFLPIIKDTFEQPVSTIRRIGNNTFDELATKASGTNDD